MNLKPGGERKIVVDESECYARPIKASEREGNVRRLRKFSLVRALVRAQVRAYRLFGAKIELPVRHEVTCTECCHPLAFELTRLP